MELLSNVTQRASIALSTAGLILVVCLTAAPVTASTPDGETPANEGVCDTLQGATPGLYGLCVAYCEAQDLDDYDDKPSRTRILANYRKKMQAGDQDMPCIQVPCACVSQEELNSMTADGLVECNRLSGQIRIEDNVTGIHFATTDTTVNRERCVYVKAMGGSPTVRNMLLDEDGAQACYTAIDEACASVGE